MPDPNLTIPAEATPDWLLRYADWRAVRYERRMEKTRKVLPSLRTRRARRILVLILIAGLLLGVAASIAAFWSLAAAGIPFVVGVVGALIALTLVRISTGGVADAPSEALDELQLAQRNAARSFAYILLLPVIIGIYFGAIALSTRDYVAGDTVAALAWLLISATFAISCLPEILLTWWLPEPSDDEE
ncbi:hypothetical protein [Gordonia sp. FQ]|uniref:hypothetical protein n=1 Tax=Gordonia sp. FQ TaxID=3446634 RepID=UPI003F85E85B